MRKYFPEINLKDGLTVRDKPILELYCHNSDSQVGYCRLFSTKHDGPVFASPKSLYETYNCSSQGHIDNVFVYSAADETDEDAGRDLAQFLEINEILKPEDFTEEQLQFFKESVANNPLLNAYQEALEKKRTKKAADGKKTTVTAAGTVGATAVIVDSVSGTADGGGEESSNNAATTAAEGEGRKRPGRPKGSKSGDTTKRAKRKTSHVPTIRRPMSDVHPTGVSELHIDTKNFENSKAVFTYQSEPIRLGDLGQNSVERATMCWNIFGHILQRSINGFTVPKSSSPEDVLRQGLQDISPQNGGSIVTETNEPMEIDE